MSLESENKVDEDLFKPKLSSEFDLLESEINSRLTTDDLLGLSSNSEAGASELLSPTTTNNTTIENDFFATSEHFNQSINRSNHLLRNTSTPNLANIDPFEDLGAFLDFSNPDSNKPNVNIPRVYSYTTFSNENKNSCTEKSNMNRDNTTASYKPNYSRTNFNDISAATGVKTPRMQGNEFEDLLGGFIKSQPDNPKSIAQLRKEELVFIEFEHDFFILNYIFILAKRWFS